MTSTSSAHVTGLPSPRRAFLRQLATLPLIGGAVTLIGTPTAAAVAPTPEIIETYKTWLDMEMRWLAWEVAADPLFRERYRMRDDGSESRREIANNFKSLLCLRNAAANYHQGQDDRPSSRAAIVLSAVGCGWKEG